MTQRVNLILSHRVPQKCPQCSGCGRSLVDAKFKILMPMLSLRHPDLKTGDGRRWDRKQPLRRRRWGRSDMAAGEARIVKGLAPGEAIEEH